MRIDNDDLTFERDDLLLNIRVLLLIQYKDTFIFEHSRDGYYFAVGGRVKFGESSEESALRELEEELNYEDIDLRLLGLIENYFEDADKRIHEINFVYNGVINAEIDFDKLESAHQGYKTLSKSEINEVDIRPLALKEFIEKFTNGVEDAKGFIHLVNRD
jgi:8-oxo-dGTP pyrophosphatase MutT (NUDIX family)